MKHHLQSYLKGAYKSCQMQNELNILINIVQKYHMQQCITRMPAPIELTEKGNLKYEYRQRYGADNSCYLQYYKQKLSIAIMKTKLGICKCCIQKLSFAIVAYKSYHSFDAIWRFFISIK